MISNGMLLMISVAIVGIIVLLFILLFATPKASERQFIRENNLNPALKKLINTLGVDLVTMIPDQAQEIMIQESEVEKIIRRSGNPWNVTISEFIALQFATLALGVIVGGVLAAYLAFVMKDPLLAVILFGIVAYISWAYPSIKYRKIADERELEFIKRLPEAIELLMMIMTGGNYTLINGIEEVIPHLPPSPVKDEFITVVKDVDSGSSVEAALNAFAFRCPTTGIKAFVRSLNQANKLSVDIVSILDARAKASRKELYNLMDAEIQKLPTKVMLVLSPAAMFCVLLIAMSPSALHIMKLLSGM